MAIAFTKGNVKVKQFKNVNLSQYSYVVECDNEMAVIDPARDVKQYLDFAAAEHAKIKWVILTHLHSDFVSGFHDLAVQAHAKVVYGPEAHPGFECRIAQNNEKLSLGNHHLRASHTPGHTLESTSWVLEDHSNHSLCVFTGDTLFIGGVGRPDMAQNGTHNVKELSRMLYKSLKTLKTLSDDCVLFPGHGAGASCAPNAKSGDRSTIGEQLEINPLYAVDNESDFVENLADYNPPVPMCAAYIVSINKSGHAKAIEDVVENGFQPLVPDQFKTHVEEPTSIILDCRKGADYAKGHIKGSISCQLDKKFEAWAPYFIDIKHGEKIYLVVDAGREREAISRLAKVGLDNVYGFLEGGIESWTHSGNAVQKSKLLTFNNHHEFQGQVNDATVFDVRNPDEWETGTFKDAKLLPISKLREYGQATEDKNKKIIVHCRGGGRSLMAVSVLERLGFTNVTNVPGGLEMMKSKGVEVGPKSQEVVTSI